jgi:chromosome segregation ATPase
MKASQFAEAIGVALQAIGGAMVDAATAPDARDEMRREIETLRDELRDASGLSSLNRAALGAVREELAEWKQDYEELRLQLQASRVTLQQREREIADMHEALSDARQSAECDADAAQRALTDLAMAKAELESSQKFSAEVCAEVEALKRARLRILVAHAEKWSKPAALRFAPWSAFHHFVTDRAPPRSCAAPLAAAGVEIHLLTSS